MNRDSCCTQSNYKAPYSSYADKEKLTINIKNHNIETILKSKESEFEFKTEKRLVVIFQEVKEITPDVLNSLKSCNEYLFEADEMRFTYCEFKDFSSVDEIFMYFENVKELELSEVTVSNLKDSTKELSCLNSSTNTLNIVNSDIEISLSSLRNFKSLEHLSYYKELYYSEETQPVTTNSNVCFNHLKTVDIF